MTLRDSAGKGQLWVYNHCLRRARFSTKWLAFLDVDEFLWSPAHGSLKVALERNSKFASLLVGQLMFGSGGHHVVPSGGLVTGLLRCAPPTSDCHELWQKEADSLRAQGQKTSGSAYLVKPIVNPRRVLKTRIHSTGWKFRFKERVLSTRNLGLSDLYEADLLVNHYWVRGLGDLREKSLRGGGADPASRYDLRHMEKREAMLNEIEFSGLPDKLRVMSSSKNKP